MFGVNLSDRLKAIANGVDAAGTALQARAIGQSVNGTPRPASPTVPLKPPSISSSTTFNPAVERTHPESPTRTSSAQYVASTSALAENALSGLRKSFNFAPRPMNEGHRQPAAAGPIGPQEMRDIPPTPSQLAGSSRPSSPSAFLRPSTSLLGSDLSSMNGTPLPLHSPNMLQDPLISRSAHSALPLSLPVSDASDPATYPLPPSPILSSSSPDISVSSFAYADPLGASPLLESHEHSEPPRLESQKAPPMGEESSEIVGLGVLEVEVEISSELDRREEMKALEGSEEVVENGDPAAVDPKVEQKLAAAERRYEDLSERFTSLLKYKHEADKVLRELTPLEGGIQDHEALEGWVRMMKAKVEMITEEMKRLQDKVNLQDSRMEELRDTHRMEGSSQGEVISKLRSQLASVEGSLASKGSEILNAGQLRADLAKAQTQAKEEEEKRTKAISLLKTVRLKLVKAEKEREEIDKDRAEERAERSKAGEETERVKAEREREVNALRKGFERELAGAKERLEKDSQARKVAWELEMITTKATHAKELSGKATKVIGLEAIVKELNLNKAEQFEALQVRQSEVESSRAELETLQNRTKELEFQLREASERYTMLEDQAVISRSKDRGRASLGVSQISGLGNDNRATPSPSPSRSNSYSNNSSAAEVQRILAEAEARYEAKASDLRFKIRSLENERNEAEEEWAAKLQERVRELDRLRRMVTEKESDFADSLKTRKEKEALIEEQAEARRAGEREMKMLKAQIEEAKEDVSTAAETERIAREELSSVQVEISSLQSQLEDAKSHSVQLRSSNKMLRDELRKIQSSVQLMERQRNPGVGYWSTSNPGAGPARSGMMSPAISTEPAAQTRETRRSLESSAESLSMRTGRSSPAVSEVTKDKEEEEVNLEYLRNVILQFLEHKEMRPNLVRVLSVILHFTPQELRRLHSKISA